MIKHLSKITLILIMFAGFCTPTYAFKFLSQQIKHGGPALLTFIQTTSDGQSFSVTEEESDYVGTSSTAPCSDLKLFYHDTQQVTIKPIQIKSTSDDIIDYPGPGYTCFKSDMIIAGKTYSTGNIALTWDGKTYTNATPNQVEINIDSPRK